jgi:hypothetical protein
MAKKKVVPSNRILLVRWYTPKKSNEPEPEYRLVFPANIKKWTSRGFAIATPEEKKEWQKSSK